VRRERGLPAVLVILAVAAWATIVALQVEVLLR
jgi:hypothetical protein